jgi:hypothetical protein
MNFKTTIVLLVLVLGLGAFLLWKHDEVVAKPETGMTPLLPFAVAQVDSIRLKLGTGEELAMSKQDGEWWLTEPVKDIAEQDRVKEFLALMAQAVRFELEASPSPEALNALGLSGPDSRVTLTAGATTWSLRVGSRDASGAFVHVMEEGERSLARTGANLGNVLARARNEWQSRRFVHGDGALVKRLVLERPGKPRVVLTRSGVDWLLEEPLSFPAGAGAQRLLAVAMVTIREFLRASPAPEELLRTGLGDTATVLTLDWGNRQVVARFGISNVVDGQPVRYATDSVRNYLFILQGPQLEQLEKDAKDFRDPEVCRALPTSTRKVRFVKDGSERFTLEFDVTSRRFDVTSPFQFPATDDRSSALYEFFQDVSALKAASFLDEDELPPELERPYESLGLDPPRAVLTLDKVESTGIAREAIIEFGDPNGDGTVAVRRRDRFEHTVFNVPEADVARVVGADARQFLALTLFPQNVATMSEVTIRAGGKTRTLRRDKNPEAPLWRDVADPNLETGLFQQWISALPGWQPDRILPRDPIAADGFGPDEASVTIKTDDPAVKGGVLHVTFGAKAAGGRHVLAQSDAFPARTVFELPVAVIDEMLKLLQ